VLDLWAGVGLDREELEPGAGDGIAGAGESGRERDELSRRMNAMEEGDRRRVAEEGSTERRVRRLCSSGVALLLCLLCLWCEFLLNDL